MRNNLLLIASICLVVFSVSLHTGCQQAAKVETEPNEPVSPHYWTGQQIAKDYMAGKLADYRLVIKLHSIELTGRKDFLEGFASAFAEASRKEDGVKYSKILEDAVTGNQFETAREMGSKHAQRLVTNSQIQSLIQSSVGVSGSMALGWKAGYIDGFKTQKVSEAKDQGESPDKQAQEEFYKEAAATYNALRAATGR